MVGFTVGFILGLATRYAYCKYGDECHCKNILGKFKK